MAVTLLFLTIAAMLDAEGPRVQAGGCTATDDSKPAGAEEFRKARNAFEQNRIDKAIQHLQKGIRLEPASIDAYNDLGAIYFNTGAPAKAIEAFSKMVEIDPHCFRGYLNLAYAYYSTSRYSEAETAVRRAIDVGAPDARSRYLLGASLVRLGKHTVEAEEHLQAAAPEMPEAHWHLSRLLIDRGDLEGGMKQLQLYTIATRRSSAP